MAHKVDGFDLEYTGRRTWKATRSIAGKAIDVVPVAWAQDWELREKEIYLKVWYTDEGEAMSTSERTDPFPVALVASLHPDGQEGEFKEFRGVYEVTATGKLWEPKCVEAKVLKRLKAGR